MNARPAWREPMVWLTFGLPAASVVAGVLLVVTAVRAGGADDVDAAVQRRAQVQLTDLGPDETARRLQMSALVRFEAGAVEVLPVSGPMPRLKPLTLTLTHPTESSLDRHLVLEPHANGWRSKVGAGAAHDWLLRVAPADARWRVVGRLSAGASVARVGPALAPD
jgi:hypothetical protein